MIRLSLLFIFILVNSSYSLEYIDEKKLINNQLIAYGYTNTKLSEPLNINQVESSELVQFKNKYVPFGRINNEWESIKKSFRSGDYFLKFRTENHSWDNLSGREGYLHIRDETIINVIFTNMN